MRALPYSQDQILDDAEPTSQSPAHRGTFSINYPVPVRGDLSDTIEVLRGLHDHAHTSILFGGEFGDSPETINQSNSLSKVSTLPSGFDVNTNIWRQPLFDVASAEILLKSFKSTFTYLPFMVFPDDITISHLATEKPFVLLAILTVASGSRMVQKHALYDDEFRKALGLKYGSGGERSLELLQGILIYCAWYVAILNYFYGLTTHALRHPFQLRPKNGQLDHCLRIAGDLVHDLHLDEDFLSTFDPMSQKLTDNELDKIRAYLAYLYIILTYGVIWRGERDLPISRPSWISIATETLQHNVQVDGDSTLVALIRTSSLFADVSGIKEGDLQTAANCQLILRRLEEEFLELQTSTKQLITGLGAIRMQAMFVDIFLDCGGLLVLPVSKTYSKTGFCPPLPLVYGGIKKIRGFLDFVLNLDDTSLLSFTVNDWTRFIVVLTLSFRLSFPLTLCPDFDSTYARSQIRLDDFLDKMSQGTDITAQSDLLSASRYMLCLAKSKYDLRLASLKDSQSAQPVSRFFGCPVMSGNLGKSTERWQSNSGGLSEWSNTSEQNRNLLFHDIWAAMTFGWLSE
ncbi:Hypothetical protein PENO1_106900 [Penicillium occitanis (nom. inval.)]|nr:Hypothetical protein PENO1_106900 [Penicillium occitanis (nom. inval.)]PCG89265.1 hypothetical protein PENOC_107250 [Penicillium occitanis (nom. inval.)]